MLQEEATTKAERRRRLETEAYRKAPCPKCGAGPGEICMTDTGEPAAKMHGARLRMAAYKPLPK